MTYSFCLVRQFVRQFFALRPGLPGQCCLDVATLGDRRFKRAEAGL
jgi:hypothetical protein